MRDFPEDVRAVILDGVWPPQVNATESRNENAASALDAFFRNCEADPECAQRYPDLEQELWNVVRRYHAYPSTTVTFDPDSSEFLEVEVDGHFMLRRMVDSLRSDSWIPYLPFILYRIASGDRDAGDAFIDAEYRLPARTDRQLGGVGIAALPLRGPFCRHFRSPRGPNRTPLDGRFQGAGSGSRHLFSLA